MKSKSARATILILIALYLFFRWYFFPPLPPYIGSQQLVGLQEKVDIYTDEYGVPHIFAENEKDLFFTVGYIIARERLFQLSTVASAVRGELAAFFGDNALEDDIYLRTWGIPSISQKIVDGYNEETMMIAEAFCNGINAYIDEAGSRLPVEFKILRQKPIKWRPSDLAGHGRLMAHDLQQSWKAEIMFGLIQLYYGAEKTAELMPAYENHWPIIAAQEMNNIWEQFSEAVWDREQSMRNILGTNGMSIGSNSFVISGNLTQSGKPLLMNDPHLEFSQPGVWYEIHLNGGRFNVSGVCLVGLPVPIIGQNEHCAWGFTNIMADDIDFFIEKMHPENSHLYFYGDTWREMDIVEQSIPLQNGRDTTIVIRSTVHGPIISDIHPLLKNSEMAVSMSWTGHWETSELSALIKLNTMKNWDDFSSAARDFSVPGQNIVYADIEGNIGWRPAVKLPVRKDGNNLLPRPGHLPEYDWKGTVPFEEMPYIFNPEKGYIVTANQKTIDDSFPHYISNMWADPSRAMRMEELINEKKIIGVDDIKDIQGDLTSSFARELTPYILNTEKGNETGNLKTAFDLLKNWDGNESAESAATLVFHVTLNRLFYNIYYDEFSAINPKLMDGLTSLTLFASRNLIRTIKENTSSWFDNIETEDKVETRDDIIYQSVIEAVSEIENTIGNDPSIWAWGKLHTLTHPHAMGKIKALNWLFGFNVGPFATGGSAMTVNNGEYDIVKPYHQTSGPSMRRIVDFSDLNSTQMILPAGQSGLPNSPHYDDQAEMFISGQYRTTRFDETYIRNSDSFQHLILTP